MRAFVVYFAVIVSILGLPPAEGAERRAAGTSVTAAPQLAQKPQQESAEVRNIQRLLKVLAQRNPRRYATVDPGPINGVFGSQAKNAITNFQRIIGKPKKPSISRELLSQIILALAEDPGADVSTPGPKSSGQESTDPASRRDEPKPTAKAQTPAVADVKQSDHPKLFVQVASLRNLERAKLAWARLQKTYRTALSSQAVVFEQAEIKSRGTFYRVLIGPLESIVDAKNICVSLGRQSRDCIIAKRTGYVADRPKVTKQPIKNPSVVAKAVPSPQPKRDSKPPKSEAPPKVANNSAAAAAPVPPSKPDAGLPPTRGTEPEPKAEREITNTVTAATPSVPVEQPAPVAAGQPEPGREASSRGAEPDPALPTDAAGISPNSGSRTNDVTPPTNQERPKPVTDFGDFLASATKPSKDDNSSKTAENVDKTKEGKDAKRVEQSKATAGPFSIFVSHVPKLTLGRVLMLGAVGAAAFIVYFFWRRRRHAELVQRSYPTGMPAEMSDIWPKVLDGRKSSQRTTLSDLQCDFESPEMRQSRQARDVFLEEVLVTSGAKKGNGAMNEAALSVNRGLKRLIEANPALYKKIFLNWLFLDRVGAALDRHEVNADELDDPISSEFELLRSYFRIHLLELDDRHRLRSNLPGLFHCLVFPKH